MTLPIKDNYGIMTIHHTTGPWRIGDAGRTVFGPPNGNPSPKTIASNLSRPDARLIASAPELLEALQDCISQCADYEHMTDACALAFRNARHAIEKATKP